MEFLHKLFGTSGKVDPPNPRPKFKECPIKVVEGQVWVDKEWEDTELLILKVSKSGLESRYKFLKIEGKTVQSGIHTTSNVLFRRSGDYKLKAKYLQPLANQTDDPFLVKKDDIIRGTKCKTCGGYGFPSMFDYCCTVSANKARFKK